MTQWMQWMMAALWIGIPAAGHAANPSLEPKTIRWIQTTLKTKCVKQPIDPLADESTDEGTEDHYDCGKSIHLVFGNTKQPKNSFLSSIKLRTDNSQKMNTGQVQRFAKQVMSWLSEDGSECISGPSDKSNEEAYVCQSEKRGNDQIVSVVQETNSVGGTQLDYYFYPR